MCKQLLVFYVLDILCAALTRKDPKKRQKYSQAKLSVFLCFWYLCVKASRKHVDEIDPWRLRNMSRFQSNAA